MKHLFRILSLVFILGIGLTSVAQEVKINHDGENGLAIEKDGTLRADGEATCWRDELQELIGKKIYDAKGNVTYDIANATIVFESGADTDDYVIMNVQLNHDWDETTPIRPHLHWEQNENATPNWLLAYRWQVNGESKNTAWTNVAYKENAYTYDSGTIIQISSFGDIPLPSSGAGTSSIIQLKLMRDTNNDSGKFSVTDAYSGDAAGLSLDVHIKINTLGSRTEYAK